MYIHITGGVVLDRLGQDLDRDVVRRQPALPLRGLGLDLDRRDTVHRLVVPANPQHLEYRAMSIDLRCAAPGATPRVCFQRNNIVLLQSELHFLSFVGNGKFKYNSIFVQLFQPYKVFYPNLIQYSYAVTKQLGQNYTRSWRPCLAI